MILTGSTIYEYKSKVCISGPCFAFGRCSRAYLMRPDPAYAKERTAKSGGRPWQSGQTVPDTVSVAVPGVTLHTPFSPCVKVAAGTVIFPGTVAKLPVASSYV